MEKLKLELTTEQQSVIERTNKFLGYGNISESLIYFFGIEEGGTFKSVIDFKNWVKKLDVQFISIESQKYYFQNTHNEEREVNWPTEGNQAYLSYEILTKLLRYDLPPLREYLSKVFINEQRVFCSNVFPLGNPTEQTWTEIYHNETGFFDKSSYHDTTWNSRKEHLKNFIKYILDKRKDAYVFIMGGKANERLLEIFKEIEYDLEGLYFPYNDEHDYVIHKSSYPYSQLNWSCSKCKKIWFTGHPGNGWFDERVADRIIKTLLEN